jgi:hypothetical protein
MALGARFAEVCGLAGMAGDDRSRLRIIFPEGRQGNWTGVGAWTIYKANLKPQRSDPIEFALVPRKSRRRRLHTAP